MTKVFKPMLAASMDPDEGQTIATLRYPLLATPKIDGIRCLIVDGKALSRKMLPIPNRFIRSVLDNPAFNGLDGELLVGKSEPGATFAQCTDGIMREGGEPNFTYYVFDVWDRPTMPYNKRIEEYHGPRFPRHPRIQNLMAWKVPRAAGEPFNDEGGSLEFYLAEWLRKGHEGVMVRKPDGPYKNGRATWNEGYLTKVKPFADAEATIVGFEEQMHNGNEAQQDAFGRTKRSSAKANLTAKGTLGALVCKSEKFSEEFNIGTGFDDRLKREIWDNQGDWLHAIVKFKYQAIGSTSEKPRIPVFLGKRDARDLST